MIPARVNIRRMNQNGCKKHIPRNKCQMLQIQYDDRARTMDAMRDYIKEIWKIIWAFPVQSFATGLERNTNGRSNTMIHKFGGETAAMAARMYAWRCVSERATCRTYPLISERRSSHVKSEKSVASKEVLSV